MRVLIVCGVAVWLAVVAPSDGQVATQQDMWRSLEGLKSVEVRVEPLEPDFERRFTIDRERMLSDVVARLIERGVPAAVKTAESVLQVKLAFVKSRDPMYVYSLEVSLHQQVQLPTREPFPRERFPPTGARIIAATWFRSHLGTTGELHSPEQMVRQLVDQFASDYRVMNMRPSR